MHSLSVTHLPNVGYALFFNEKNKILCYQKFAKFFYKISKISQI
jgi:hypothetical protein